MSPADADVRFERVSKIFGAIAAVRGLDLDIPRGVFFSLLGPSGCGKTTMLRLIAGFEQPTSGDVYIRGRRVTDVAPYRRDYSMVFQNYALFPHLSVAENVAFGLRMRRLPRPDRDRQVREALGLVKLGGYGERFPRQLSGGQQQRVALARAIVLRPAVLLLDEPLGALDKNLREEMQVELRELQRTLGTTTVFVTHDQEEALTMSDQIAVMNNGAIEQVGPPREMYERPATDFVAGFLGVSNVFEGTVTAVDGGEATVDIGVAQVAVSDGRAMPGERVRLAVRPEKMSVLPPGEHGIPADVASVIYRGVTSHIYLDCGGRSLVVYQQNSTFDAIAWQRGDRVAVAWEKASAVIVGRR